MKILLIAQTISVQDGQGRYSNSLIRELSKKHKLIVLTYNIESRNSFLDNPNIEIHRIPNLFLSNNFFGLIKYFFQTLKFAFKVDLVHILTDYPNYILFCALPWLRIKPFIISSIGTYGVVSFERGCLKRLFLKMAYKRAKKIICISKFTQKEIFKKVSLNNSVVISCGVDYQRWQINQVISKFTEKSILGVGALKARKGYHISIAAVAEVRNRYPDLKYYIIGDQSDKNYFKQLKELIKKYQLKNNVVFREKIDDQDLIKLYHQVDLFLLTSINVGHKFEGFGLVHLEAGACGLPVIGTYNCGAEEAIENEVSGLLVPQNDIKETAKAIFRILDNSQLSKKLGGNGRQRAKEMSWQNIAAQYNQIYESIIVKN